MHYLLTLLVLSGVNDPVPDATATKRGYVNATTQTFGGTKTFVDGGVVIEGSLTVDGGVTVQGFSVVGLATTAVMTLYVDPTGNDANACTNTGTAACKTLAGVQAKLPMVAAHNVTINLAAGTYAEPFDFQPRISLNRGVTLTLTGTLTTAAPLTGTASGTSTGSSNGTQSGPSTMTDSGQSWTVNDLRGRYVTFASGALAGQSHVITANTGTTLTIANLTGPGVGVAYSIVEPGTVFSGGTTSARVANVGGPGSLNFNNLKVTRGGGQTGVMQALIGVTGPVTFTNCTFLNHSTNTFTLQFISGNVSLTRSVVWSVSASAGLSITTAQGVGIPQGGITSSYLRAETNAAVVATDWLGGSLSSVVVEGGGTAIPAVSLIGNGRIFAASLWVTCLSSSGLGFGTSTTSTSTISAMRLTTNGNLRVQGCGTGVRVEGPSSWLLSGLTVDTTTTAIAANRGAVVDFFAGTPTFTGVITELSLDGTPYAFTALSGLSPPQALSSAFGSRFIR